MHALVRQIPGLIGAVAAYGVLRLTAAFNAATLTELAVFVLTYAAVTLAAHRAVKAYGARDSS